MTELIVGRVGQLFRDPVCPETCVITVPRALIEAEPIRMGGGLAEEGAALGSLVIPHATETKSGGPLSSVPPTRLATILAFQALMQVDDAAALVRDDGAWAHSIDHGHYFGGGSWGSHHGPAAERPQINPMSGLDMGPFRVRSVWDQAVADLDAIDDEALARAFTDVPVEWGCDIQFLGPLLGATSRRRERLREVIDDYC